MVSLHSFIVAYGLTLLPAFFTTASPIIPRYFERELVTRADISADTVSTELGPQLSNGSLIFGPENAGWANETWRWNTFSEPDVQVVVEPHAESDIAKIIKYCAANSFEFLIRNRGHGLSTSLSKFSGIQINVENLQGITIDKESMTGTFQAGVFGGLVINTLWDEGFVTTTGSAACVGLMGPSLGGGHSRYEGLYGMVMDTIVHYNVVLADGTELGVNETSHPDLLWALKGAGHNFAAVTSVTKKIFPRDNWYYHTYTFTQDKLEVLFETLNKFGKSANGTTPPRMGVNYGMMVLNPAISTTEAVITWGFHYAGSKEDAEELLAPFNAIGAIEEDSKEVTYPELSGAQDYACPQANRIISSALTLEYNITTERMHYDQYMKHVTDYPDLAAGAYLYYEGYATAGYQAIPSESTAYAFREENHIFVSFGEVPDGKPELKPAAEAWSKAATDLWNEGQPGRSPKVYVNYAAGNDFETLEKIYGEEWRLERLRSLKATYDPENRFRYYVPIIAE